MGTQRKLKEEKKAKKKSGTLDQFVKVSKKGNVQYLSPKDSEFSDPDDPGVPKIKILKDTESKTNPGVTERKDKDKDKEEDNESMLIGSDDDKDKDKDKDKDYKEDTEIESDDDKDKDKDKDTESMLITSHSDDEDFQPIYKD